jgi:hypothetical protein
MLWVRRVEVRCMRLSVGNFMYSSHPLKNSLREEQSFYKMQQKNQIFNLGLNIAQGMSVE